MEHVLMFQTSSQAVMNIARTSEHLKDRQRFLFGRRGTKFRFVSRYTFRLILQKFKVVLRSIFLGVSHRIVGIKLYRK